jgi:hypothetical protein
MQLHYLPLFSLKVHRLRHTFSQTILQTIVEKRFFFSLSPFVDTSLPNQMYVASRGMAKIILKDNLYDWGGALKGEYN